MSTRRYIRPPNLLAEALELAAPQTAGRAIEKASENLSGMAEQCRERIDVLLRQIDEASRTSGIADIRDALPLTYALAVKLVGLGTPAGYPDVDAAAQSLCDTVDGIMSCEIPDPRFQAIVAVHTSAMRQLRNDIVAEDSAAVLLDGLKSLRSRFAIRPVGEAPSET